MSVLVDSSHTFREKGLISIGSSLVLLLSLNASQLVLIEFILAGAGLFVTKYLKGRDARLRLCETGYSYPFDPVASTPRSLRPLDHLWERSGIVTTHFDRAA
eukprot:scaffold49883_cov29-Tisochrysis_lutea.AAC.1